MRSGAVGLQHAVALVAEQRRPAARRRHVRRRRPPARRRASIPRTPARCRPTSISTSTLDLAAGRAAAAASSSTFAASSTATITRPSAAMRASSAALIGPTTWFAIRMSVEARVHQRARLPDVRGRDADRAGVELHAGQHRALVDLGVRPQRGGQPRHARAPSRRCSPDARQVEQQRRRGRCVARRADQAPRDVEPALAQSYSGSPSTPTSCTSIVPFSSSTT